MSDKNTDCPRSNEVEQGARDIDGQVIARVRGVLNRRCTGRAASSDECVRVREVSPPLLLRLQFQECGGDLDDQTASTLLQYIHSERPAGCRLEKS